VRLRRRYRKNNKLHSAGDHVLYALRHRRIRNVRWFLPC
jgi:hypothetical protein